MHLYKTSIWSRHRGLIVTAVIFVVVLASFFFIMNRTTQKTSAQEEQHIRTAITRAAVTCYTLEGRYPTDLQYLIDNYGLIINTDDYVVGYTAYAENLMPEVFVAAKPSR